MLIPLSWLKEFVDIKMPFKELAGKLSAAGLTIETWKEVDGDIIFDPEITPNRPDWMSVYGIAREIAVVTNQPLKRSHLGKVRPSQVLEITIKPNYEIVPRITSVIIRNVKVKSSPEWLQKRIKQIGLRPINNLVDITNYVLWEYGSLLHVFDYDKIRGHQMVVELSKGGEDFRSLDGIDYKLPKAAIIIKDLGRVIDLLPLKGGDNTAVSMQTTNVLLHSVVVDPIITRRTSQTLGLRSDSSAIAERGLDPNGTIVAINKAMELILELAGGEVASEIIDMKIKEFKPWTVDMSHSRLESTLGIKISATQVKNIFEKLGLKVQGEYKVTIPTFRNDIHIEEDLIEEVGRIYGYNNFPKNLPASAVPTTPVAYKKDYDFEYSIKKTLTGAGFNEIYSYSLVPEKQLLDMDIDSSKSLRVDNPISRDFEYLRPNLLGNLLSAYKLNQANFKDIKLFELGKRYLGETLDKITEETWLWVIQSGEKTLELKGLLATLETNSTIRPATKLDNHYWFHPGRVAHIETPDKKYYGVVGEIHPKILAKWEIKERVSALGLNYNLLEKLSVQTKKYQPIPKYPAIVEDISVIAPEKILYQEIVETIKKTSSLISSVDLLSTHENTRTLRIIYLDHSKNLTDQDVAQIRNKVTKKMAELKVVLKD